MSNSKFLSNASWMIGGKVFQMSISLVIGMITARYLGPSNFGVINYTASFVAFFTSICTLGLNGIIVKELIDNPDLEGEILGTSIIMRLASSLFSCISILYIIKVLNPEQNIFLVVAFLQVISLVFQSFDMINYWYQAKMMSKFCAIIQSVGYLAMTVYRIIILILGKSIEWFAFCTSLDMIVISSLLLISYYRNGGKKLRFSWELSQNMLSKSYHFILSGLMVAVYGQMDKIMLGKMISTDVVGFYSTAAAICSMWTFVLLAIIDAARPIIMEVRNENKELYKRRLKQLYAAIIWMSFSVSVIFSIFAKWIILILYGKQFIPAAAPLRIIVWSTAFSYLGVARGIWLVCEGKQKYVKHLSFLGAVCNLIFNFMLIPRIGITGAAIATLITQIMTNFIIPMIIKETRENSIYIIDAFLLKDVVSKETIQNVICKIIKKELKSV